VGIPTEGRDGHEGGSPSRRGTAGERPIAGAAAAGRDRGRPPTPVHAPRFAVWPASEVDKARTDGEQLGQAVAQLQDAHTAEEVDAALVELDAAVSDTAVILISRCLPR
jgi:hypothetical protein